MIIHRTALVTAGRIRHAFAIVIGTILAGEIMVMSILANIPPLPPWLIIVFDSMLISLFVFPVLYVFFYRPLIDLTIEQNRITEQHKIFKQTFMGLNSAVNIADMNDNIIFVNPAFCRLYGYTERELLGVNSSIFWTAHNPSEVTEQILPATLQGGWRGQLYNRKKDGSEFPVFLSTSVINNETGSHVALIGMVEDISVRIRREQEQRVLYEIAQSVSTTSNLNELLKEIHRVLKSVLYAENFFVAIHDSSTGLFSFPYFVDQIDPVPEPVAMEKSCSAYVFRNNAPFLFSQDKFDQLVEQHEIVLVGTPSPSWLGVPLRIPDKTIGVMVVQHYEKENVYSQHDVQFFETVANHIAVAIQRKWTADSVRESEEMFRRLFDESTDPILLLDDSGFFRCNPSTVSILGYRTAAEVLNKKPWEHSPQRQPDGQLSVDKAQQMIATAIEKGYHRFEWMHTRADGSDLPVEVMLTPVILNGKQFLYTIWRDITERKKADENLRQSEERFRAVTTTAHDGIITANGDGNIIGWNNGAKSIFGYDENELIGKKLTQIIPEHLLELHRSRMAYVSLSSDKQDSSMTVEIHGLHKNGNEIPIELSLSHWETSTGKYFSGIIRDITERKRIQAERELLIFELQEALEQIKTLKGIVPICARCKKIRDDKGFWEQVDAYVTKHTEAQFSHSICPECTQQYLQDLSGMKDQST